MDGEEKEVGETSLPEKPNRLKYILIAGTILVILFVVAVFIAISLGVKKAATTKEDYFSLAVKDKDLSECDKFGSSLATLSCKVSASVSLGNFSFCENVLGENPVIYTTLKISNNTYSLKLNEKDYCWFEMAERSDIKYCDNIADNQAKTVCLEYKAVYG